MFNVCSTRFPVTPNRCHRAKHGQLNFKALTLYFWNIDILDKNSKFLEERAYLGSLGKVIKDFFKFKNDAIVVSNACVSGVLAVTIAKRYITQGIYDNVFVVSGDIVTEFILSGFNSFQALSSEPCKPYSKNRTGINIGEVAASVLVTKKCTCSQF